MAKLRSTASLVAAAKKAARTRRQNVAVAKARRNGRVAETLFRALTARLQSRWRLVSFRGRRGGESRGVVDVLAVRRRTRGGAEYGLRSGDLFEFILVQLKGGDAREPSDSDVVRLRTVAGQIGATRVVLYSWKDKARSTYQILDADGWAECVSARVAFA